MNTVVLLVITIVYSLHVSHALTKLRLSGKNMIRNGAPPITFRRASLSYKDGEVSVNSDKGKDVVLQPGQGGRVRINGPVQMNGDFKTLRLRTSSRSTKCTSASKGITVYQDGGLAICDGVRFVSMNAKLGSLRNPASSCKAILEDDWSSPSGAYYIKTDPSVTKAYCYMEDIPGCGKGGWTTIIKANGHMATFHYYSSLWTNKKTYHVSGGQSGADHQETKLPTYWTMPFKSLCLGMVTMFQSKPNWIRLDYSASSLYSVIADNRYRSFSLGRNKWKSLISGSSLQRNCNREGFNSNPVPGKRATDKIRIGIIGNQENDCYTPDSRIGFGGAGWYCGSKSDDAVSIGDKARCRGDAGNKVIQTFGYILAQ